MNEEQFWAVMTSKRDEGLAHLTAMIERSGVDEFCKFLVLNVMPTIADNAAAVSKTLIHHMAMVGAVDALLAHRDREVSP